MTEQLLHVSTFVLPPALGAIIGYVTNAIAIRMLFRPLREKRIFGFRVPLTPGIIPRQRGQLAESIGRMVSQRLLTEEVIREQIESERFRDGLTDRVSRLSGTIVAVPGEERDRTGRSHISDDEREVLQDKIFELAGDLLERFLESERLEQLVRSIVRQALEGISTVTLGEAFQNREKALSGARTLIEGILEGPVAEAISDIADRWAEQQTDENTSLNHFISDDMIRDFEALLDAGYHPAFDYLVDWLRQPDVRDEMAYRGRIILREVLDRLNLFQRLLVSAGQYERQLRERMPEIIDDFIENINRTGRLPQNRRRVVHGIGSALRRLQSLGVADVQETLNFDLRATAKLIINRVFVALESETVQDGIARSLDDLFDRYEDKPIGEILTGVTGLREDQMVDRVMGTYKEWLNRPGASRALSEKIVVIVRSYLQEARAGGSEPLLTLEPEQKQTLDRFLSDRIVAMVSARVPELVATFNVHQMVVDRINNLNVENVENLLLMVIAKHLKWINLFGAILGATIGAIQIVLNLIT